MSHTKNRLDLTGRTFERWEVLRYSHTHDGVTYWICKCKCGTERPVCKPNLLKGISRSCGCLMRDVCSAKAKQAAGAAMRTKWYKIYRRNAEQRKLPFKLTKKQFLAICDRPCHYCGAQKSIVVRNSHPTGDYECNGVDRINNAPSVGYTVKNSVPCCRFCNHAKGTLSYAEFISHISSIFNHSCR